MASYVNITLAEMDEFLMPQGFSKYSVNALGNVREVVYGKRIDVEGLTLSLRVYTGINLDGNSRDVGSDAIRCNIFWRNSEGDIRKVASSKRVHRVAGWKANLQQRLDSLTIEARCDKCSAPMVNRKSKRGEFLGCANFPNCRNTKEA